MFENYGWTITKFLKNLWMTPFLQNINGPRTDFQRIMNGPHISIRNDKKFAETGIRTYASSRRAAIWQFLGKNVARLVKRRSKKGL